MAQKYSGHHIKYQNFPVVAYPASQIEGDIVVEIGPGRGDFLFHLAETNPEKIIYGIEIQDKRFYKLIPRRDKKRLFNIRLILADAEEALPQLFKNISVSAIYINFPDPWPKKRHANKRLLLKDGFISKCAELLKPKGSLSITTDVKSYAYETFELCSGINQLRSTTNAISTQSDEAYPTLFAEKWKSEGRTIYYQKYLKSVYSPSP